MSLLNLILLLVVAAICGAIGQALVGYSFGGFITSTLIGFVGALIGTWLARQLGLPEPLSVRIGGETFPILWSIVGSALLVGIAALAAGRRRVV